MTIYGYSRVSTTDQNTAMQREAMEAAGAREIFEETMSGASRSRPKLAQLLAQVRFGDVVLVWKIDRLARSLSHLLDIIERLQSMGVAFRSLTDPIDTSTPQGKFALQVLGAAAELERNLNRERTLEGIKSARAKGRVGGNPRLKEGDPAALKKLREQRVRRYMADLNATAHEWLPIVRRMRPDHPWEDVARVLNAGLPEGRDRWTTERLSRAVRRFISEGLAEKVLLGRAKTASRDDRLLVVVAGIAGAAPTLTLQDICDRLEAMREPTPRGKRKWHPSSVRMLLERARAKGLIEGQDRAHICGSHASPILRI